MEIEVASVFGSVLNFSKRFVLIRSGRAGGKSTFTAQLIVALTQAFRNRDVIICRDNYSDLENSSYQELLQQIEGMGLSGEYNAKKDPLRIECMSGGNIYFLGIGGADTSRTRSFKTPHKCIAIIFEELQQVRDQESYEQAQASFRRLLDTKVGMMVHLYNPMPSNSHWLNIFWNLKENDADWSCIWSSYKDVAKFLSDMDLKEIIKMKLYDFERYKWMYLGKTTGGFGSVYNEFKPEKHLISREMAGVKFGQNTIVGIIVGVDTAVTHDKVAYVPLLLLNNGQCVVSGRDMFIHDPISMGQYGSAELIPHIQKWYGRLNSTYGIDKNNLPILMVVDSAGTELIKLLRYHMPANVNVMPFNKPTIVNMVDNVKGVLARNMVYIINDGWHQTTVGDKVMENQLAKELSQLEWKQNKDTSMPMTYNPAIPNDVCDAFTYAVNMWFKNPKNLYFIAKTKRKDYYDIEEG